MSLRSALAIVAAVAVVVVPPAGFGLSVGASRQADTSAPGSLVTDAVAVPRDTSAVPLAPTTEIRLALTLSFSNASRLALVLAGLEDPGSPSYHHFLTYAQAEREFGPSAAAVNQVETVLRAHGASSVSVAPAGLAVEATVPAGSVSSLLGVRMVGFGSSGTGSGYTTLGTPSLPAGLAGNVVAIDGLSGLRTTNLVLPTLSELSPARPAPELGEFVQQGPSGPSQLFIGSDFTQAYEADTLLPGADSVHGATFPTGVAIATLLASGYNATFSTALPPWSYSVVDDYFNDTFPAAWPHPTIRGVPVPEAPGSTPPPPGPFGTYNDSTLFETENSLDLEMAGSLAPGADLYNFYVSGALLAVPPTSLYAAQYLTDALGAALAFNYSTDHLAVVSCSFGLADTNDSTWDADLVLAAAMGVTVVASSGDQGDAPNALSGRDQGQWPLWPATAAYNGSGVVSVGGVSLELSGTPTSVYEGVPLVVSYDSGIEGIANTSVWFDKSGGPGSYAGSEGGVSSVYAEPSWQFHSAAQPAIVNATRAEGLSQLGRAGPDVAFPANSTISYVAALPNGTPEFEILAGTSVAAPVFAGLLADVVAVQSTMTGHATGLGYLTPELYRIASYYQANPGNTSPFLPVLYGSNEVFSAGPGWTAADGWGGLYAPLFLRSLDNTTVANYTYTGPTPTLPAAPAPATSWFTIAIVATAAGAVVVAIVVLLGGRLRRSGQGAAAPADPRLEPPASGPVVTFSCPYCGAERPAEPGHCPACGAM